MCSPRVASIRKWIGPCVLSILFVTAATVCSAQTFTTLHYFNGKGGADPQAGLVQATDGNLYGTTFFGGVNGIRNPSGTVFEVTPSGTFKMLYSFCSQSGCADGYGPMSTLIQASDGNLYGTTSVGGVNSGGTIFRVTLSGKLTTLYSFCSQRPNCTDGARPLAGLIQATDGNLYGTTRDGGANTGGTVFRMTLNGTLTTLYSFCSLPNCTDGFEPLAPLMQATNGNFYGTASNSTNGGGVVFEISSGGRLTTLYRFCSQTSCADGSDPVAGLIQASDGYLYGTTFEGGANDKGTVFKITPEGQFSKTHDFCSELPNCADGGWPQAGLIQATDGDLYGTTSIDGGIGGSGTAFKIAPDGTLTTVYVFGSQTGDGESPVAPLVQATNGNFYGTTSTQGKQTYGVGTIFSGSLGLAPFVETQTTSGKVGAVVTILGNNLNGSTGVSFGAAPATFTVNSNSNLKATVPNGATTGVVTVTTPDGTLTSNQDFRILPEFTGFTPPSGPVGTVVTITGVSLTQTTAVTFDGVSASSFTVNSDTQVTATVPAGSKTGVIVIRTVGGRRWSPTAFTVTP